MQPRLHGLDALRGILMLLGVVLHGGASYMASSATPEFPLRDPYRSPLMTIIIAIIHSARMPIFFFIAGFFSHYLYISRSNWSFVKNRVQRILVPFLVGLIILIPATLLSFLFALGSVSYDWDGAASVSYYSRYLYGIKLFGNIDEGNELSYLWFLYYLLICYVFVLVQALLWRDKFKLSHFKFWGLLCKYPYRYVFLIPLFLIFLTMPGSLLMTSATWLVDLRVLLLYLFMFWLGWLYWVHKDIVMEKKSNYSLILSFCFVVLLFVALSRQCWSMDVFG